MLYYTIISYSIMLYYIILYYIICYDKNSIIMFSVKFQFPSPNSYNNKRNKTSIVNYDNNDYGDMLLYI